MASMISTSVRMKWLGTIPTLLVLICLGITAANAMGGELSRDDWTRFRGDNGTGHCRGKPVPVRWSDTQNIAWRTELPGAGFSSPIVAGNQIFVTCYSGYGLKHLNPGPGHSPDCDLPKSTQHMKRLRRHLICIDRVDGSIRWSKTVKPVLPEDPISGFGLSRHGYASSTPTTDGERVYVFFGKTGVLAFDMDGNRLWQTSVGRDSGSKLWGSAASPVLYKDLVIVNASDESRSLVALNKHDGREVWRSTAELLDSTWATPILMRGPQGHELIIAVPGEIWGLNPNTGNLKWYVDGFDADWVCASLVADDDVIYYIGNSSGKSGAVRIGGRGNVTKSHVVWKSDGFGRISSPVYYKGHLYGSNGGIAYCVDAKTGRRMTQIRLPSGEAPDHQPTQSDHVAQTHEADTASDVTDSDRAERSTDAVDAEHRESSRSKKSGDRRGQGRADYGSAVLAGGKVYMTTTTGVVHVIAAAPELPLLASNSLSDGSQFNATPAISRGQLILRSNRYLYCIADD